MIVHLDGSQPMRYGVRIDFREVIGNGGRGPDANADWEWGPWCTETGWTQPWIAGTLALRQMKTSLWDLTKDVAIGPSFQRCRAEMLPDEALGKD